MRRGLCAGASTILLMLAACTTTLGPALRTATSSPSPTASPPSSTSTRTPTPVATTAPPPTHTPVETPIATTEPGVIDEAWVDPPEHGLPETSSDAATHALVPNARRDFWVPEAADGGRRSVEARLRIQSTQVQMWVAEGLWHDIRQLESVAEMLEADVFPKLRAAFDPEWSPGLNGEPRVAILHVSGLNDNVLGYTSSLDAYPNHVHPWANEAQLITINVDAVDIGSPEYEAVLARSLVHLILRRHDRNEEPWVREGLGDLGAALVGADSEGLIDAYVMETDVPLRSWEGTAEQRGGAFLLMAYFRERMGEEGIHALVREPRNGVRGFDAALGELGEDLTFAQLFGDWLASIYLESAARTSDVTYGFSELDLAPPKPAAVYHMYPVTTESSLQQFGAHFIVLQGEEDLQIEFSGQAQTPLSPDALADRPPVWWSNRADESRTQLLGRVDLSDLEIGRDGAVLSYSTWYDIEEHYDYATLEVSGDMGQSWRILETPSGTASNPYLNNPGWGYTGRSQGWIREEIDLPDDVGETLLVRFSYLTDGAITGDGLLLDDISVTPMRDGKPGTGLEISWTAEGFLRTDGWVEQDYLASLIFIGDEITVQRLAVTEDGDGEWAVPLQREDVDEAVLILSALAPATHHPAAYGLDINASQPTPAAESGKGGD